MADAPTLIAPPHPTLACTCCGFRLGDRTPTGVRVVVPHRRRDDGTIVARCPHCRRGSTWREDRDAA